jgi:prepilin-type processing-associated H-X9-DG protein
MKKKILLIAPVLLAVYLLSVFIAEKLNTAREYSCFANMERLGKYLNMYANDYDDVYPNRKAWEEILPKKYSDIYCPSSKSKLKEVKNVGFYGYAINDSFIGLNRHAIPFPHSTIMIFESAAGILSGTDPRPFRNMDPRDTALEQGWSRHRGGSNYLFADGKVQWRREEEVLPIDDYNGNDGVHPNFNLRGGVKQMRDKH